MFYVKSVTATYRLLVLLAFYSHYSLAEPEAVFSPQLFIEKVSLKTISEIETAKIALQKSVSTDVKAYAKIVISENTIMLKNLRLLATEEHLQMLGDDELSIKAHKYVFKRTGQTFDAAYIGKRIAERKRLINLFREAIEFGDPNIKRYASNSLPALMHHLYAVQQLHENIKMLVDAETDVQKDDTVI